MNSRRLTSWNTLIFAGLSLTGLNPGSIFSEELIAVSCLVSLVLVGYRYFTTHRVIASPRL